LFSLLTLFFYFYAFLFYLYQKIYTILVSSLFKKIRQNHLPTPLLIFGLVSVLSIWIGLISEQYYLLAIPALLLLIVVSIMDYRKIYFLLLICIPLSTELVLPSGFGTDLPTEPLTIGLMGIFIVKWFKNPQVVEIQFFKHPISMMILLHFGWLLTTTITSGNPFISVKFLLAKAWYIIVFYWMSGSLLRDKKSLKTAFWCITIPLLLTLVVVNIRHAAYGFSFESIFRVLNPFYRNHVAYACIMAVMYPFIFFAIYWYRKNRRIKWFLIFSLLFLTVSVYLSFTRAAYIAILLAGVLYFVIRFRAMKYVLTLSILMTVVGLGFMAYQNNYLDYAPDYDKTISHTEFDDLITATYNLEDISLMERFYRWVGGFFMVKEQPLVGFGPGNFYNFYKSYTINRFRTYVSDNPEQSGIHNYYLMTAVEQGLPGLFFFVLLCFVVLLKAEHAYHRCVNALRKSWIMATVLSFTIILVTLIINDLIETDKIGSFFFLLLALLVNFDLDREKETT
ncbi:MAG: O-antigen ligase family protein, partial [Bacteroidota bacterium]